MDFRFTDEQGMTAQSVRTLLADRCTPADLRRLIASGAARDEARWTALTELGLLGALVPEEHGGLGLSPVDVVQVADTCGAAALPEPLIENMGVTLPLLAAVAGDARATAALAQALDAGAVIALGHPANPCIANADTAAFLMLAHDDGLHLVPVGRATLTPQPSIDPLRRLFTVDSSLDASTHIADAATAAPALARAFEHGALFAAAQLLGLAQRCIDLATAYAKERQQFGKPIGSYQAVKHLLATAQVKVEFARPVVYAAAAALSQRDAVACARVSHAKIAAADAADLAARTAVQVHGAMGYSWEVDVHIFLKRTLALTGAWGAQSFHRARVAARVFDAPIGPDQTFSQEAAHA